MIRMMLDNLTIVLPAWNEAASIGHVIAELRGIAALRTMPVLVVDDGSTDGTAEKVCAMAATDAALSYEYISHGGKDVAIWTALPLCHTAWVVVMDADGQYTAQDIVALAGCIGTDSYDAVWGRRRQRCDNYWRRLQSQVALMLKTLYVGTPVVHDAGCGLFIARCEHMLAITNCIPRPYGQVHCHLADLLDAMGAHVVQRTVHHRSRRGGCAKYGCWNRLWTGWVSLRQAARAATALRSNVPEAIECTAGNLPRAIAGRSIREQKAIV